eukprot:COSAG02_NODE_644_length_18993_cov_6.626389_5_plen_67_part_00
MSSVTLNPDDLASQRRPVVAQFVSICLSRPHAHFPNCQTVRTAYTRSLVSNDARVYTYPPAQPGSF